MASYDIAPGVSAALRGYTLPATLGRGAVNAPVMYSVDWAQEQWGRGLLRPYGRIEVLPGARALHHAEVVFEALKAYRVGGEWPNLFRPQEIWRRLAISAQRQAIPSVPEALFFEAIDAVVVSCSDFIPRESGCSLYLRPFIYGTQSGYPLRDPATFTFMVIANPMGPSPIHPLRVMIEREDARVAGGLGASRAATSPAAPPSAFRSAAVHGLAVTLRLDARGQRWIQASSGTNIFAVIGDELHTPELDVATLPGIMRDSLLILGRHLGLEVIERRLELDELLDQISSGRCTEMFACGTPAGVSPISSLAESNGVPRDYALRQVDVVAARLRGQLLAIQERRAPDLFGWTRDYAPLPRLK